MISRDANPKSDREPRPQAAAFGLFAPDRSVLFRPMSLADLDEVMVIERSSFRFPWSMGFFRQEIQVACARSILAEVDGRIAAYVLYWILPGAVDIHNIAVRAEYRRRGIARNLLGQVIAAAKDQSITRVLLEVRQSNLAAQNLYAAMGFIKTGIRKGYYSDNGEDAFAMTLELDRPF